MTRRRLIIEWDDEGTDTDQECADAFKAGDWDVHDLLKIDELSKEGSPDKVNVKVWVEDVV